MNKKTLTTAALLMLAAQAVEQNDQDKKGIQTREYSSQQPQVDQFGRPIQQQPQPQPQYQQQPNQQPQAVQYDQYGRPIQLQQPNQQQQYDRFGRDISKLEKLKADQVQEQLAKQQVDQYGRLIQQQYQQQQYQQAYGQPQQSQQVQQPLAQAKRDKPLNIMQYANNHLGNILSPPSKEVDTDGLAAFYTSQIEDLLNKIPDSKILAINESTGLKQMPRKFDTKAAEQFLYSLHNQGPTGLGGKLLDAIKNQQQQPQGQPQYQQQEQRLAQAKREANLNSELDKMEIHLVGLKGYLAQVANPDASHINLVQMGEKQLATLKDLVQMGEKQLATLKAEQKKLAMLKVEQKKLAGAGAVSADDVGGAGKAVESQEKLNLLQAKTKEWEEMWKAANPESYAKFQQVRQASKDKMSEERKKEQEAYNPILEYDQYGRQILKVVQQ